MPLKQGYDISQPAEIPLSQFESEGKIQLKNGEMSGKLLGAGCRSAPSTPGFGTLLFWDTVDT